MLSLSDRQSLYSLFDAEARRRAMGLATLRLRDLSQHGLEREDIAQEALARLWLAAERKVARKPRFNRNRSRYLQMLMRLKLRFYRRGIAWAAPEVQPAARIPDCVLLALPSRLQAVALLCAAGLSRNQVAIAIYGDDGGDKLDRAAQLVEFTRETVRAVARGLCESGKLVDC